MKRKIILSVIILISVVSVITTSYTLYYIKQIKEDYGHQIEIATKNYEQISKDSIQNSEENYEITNKIKYLEREIEDLDKKIVILNDENSSLKKAIKLSVEKNSNSNDKIIKTLSTFSDDFNLYKSDMDRLKKCASSTYNAESRLFYWYKGHDCN